MSNNITQAFICDAIRTPFGRYGGALSSIRTDDLGAIPLRALMARNPQVDWAAVTDVFYGNANQAGEDNRNVAHMSSLLAGLPMDVPGATLNRLCGSGLDAVGSAARAIKSGEAGLMIAGGVESMSRAPFVMPKAETAFSRNNAVYDTTIGWRFVNKLMKEKYGVDSMPETAENVATDYKIEREAQDRMALASQMKAVAAQKAGHLAREITAVTIPQKKGDAIVVDQDEHPRETSMESLSKLKGVVRPDGTVTAGNASGVNDGSCALLLANETLAGKYGLTPKARVQSTCGGHGHSGCCSTCHGHWSCTRHSESFGANRSQLGSNRCDRIERSICSAGLGCIAHVGFERRRRTGQCLGRRHCFGSSIGCLGCTLSHHGCESFACHGWPLCAVHHVHWCGSGHCCNFGTRLRIQE